MHRLHLTLATVFALFFLGCSAPVPPPVKVEATPQKIDFLADVKPILDKRCVVCHSCYNSPCQAKMSSYEGIDRGGSKILVYDAVRLSAIDPTRLFFDAQTTAQWREKGFHGITDSPDTNASVNDSIMLHMLHHKNEHPEIIGTYDPENEAWTCAQDTQELGEYFEDKPYGGMPYGFPVLKKSEYDTLAQWLQQGAPGPDKAQQKKLTSPGTTAATRIAEWEAFLNAPDAKHAVTARYLYEHFFLAHLHFRSAPGEFFELVRSRTASPEPIDVIATTRPFDDPGTETFFYRFRRIHSTIVHKTHMVVEIGDAELARINELFIEPEWMETPHRVGYDTKTGANPFVAYFQIPVRSRYQFLLDHNNYIVMTFIRGPVCRGQMALNVIHDHFWVMFQDPDYDLSIQQPGFLLRQADNLSMPIETVSKSVWQTFTDAYLKKYKDYFKAKQALYDRTYPEGIGLEGIWKGDRPEDAPLLTVYRHFNSASVHRGVVGELPRTMWVIDYPQFERIYYALVAGYDVYGNVSHQTNIRRYMDFLRMEGELNFIAYMPGSVQTEMFKSWYIGDDEIQQSDEKLFKRDTGVVYKTKYPKNEFIEQVVNGHILKSTGITFDDTNYYHAGEKPPEMPTEFHTVQDLRNGARSLTAPGMGFVRHIVDHGANLLHLRVIMPDGQPDLVRTLVVNRWHDNVNSLFNEEKTLHSDKDTIDIVTGSVGSYPNAFGIVHFSDLPDFFDLIAHFDGSEKYYKKFKKYFISRSDPDFWKTYDWFQTRFEYDEPLQAGLYDLNRYYRTGW